MADEKENKVATKKPAEKKTETKKASNTTKKDTKPAEKKNDKKATTTKSQQVKKETANKTKAVKVNKKETNIDDELIASATLKYGRISSRKIKIVADLIRGKNVDEAIAILQFTQKAGAEILLKLLNSAIANAENNKQMNHSKLYIAEIYSNQGPTLKRIRPAAKGSAVRIRKRTSHTTIVLKEKEA